MFYVKAKAESGGNSALRGLDKETRDFFKRRNMPNPDVVRNGVPYRNINGELEPMITPSWLSNFNRAGLRRRGNQSGITGARRRGNIGTTRYSNRRGRVRGQAIYNIER